MSDISRNKDFSVSVSIHPAQELFGIKIRTNMHTCKDDCPKLWKDIFIPLMSKIKLKKVYPAWGACCAYDAASGDFDYWALTKKTNQEVLPEEFKEFTISPGLYAQCHLTSIAEIHTAYYYLYSRWLPSQSHYIFLEDAVSFEYYPANFVQTGQLSIFIPIDKINVA